MHLNVELNQKQTLNLKLNPELRQSVNILQYSSLELVDYLQQQSVDNPVLEIKEQTRYEEEFNSSKKSAVSSDYNPIIHCSDTKTSLEKHLMEQVMTLQNTTPLQIKILKFLIGNLNHHGFLEIEPAIAARIFSIPLTEIEQVITILQSFEPIGVGARNLADCLLIQMRASTDYPSLAFLIVEKHLADLASKNYRKLAKTLNVSLPEIQEAEDFIKTLNPRPCSEYHHEMTQYIAPDVIIASNQNEYVITVNDTLMPKVSINYSYQLDQNMESANDFLKEKYHEAMILLTGITERKRTLYKVTQAIVERQKEFLQKGLSGLKPMTLKDISEQLGYHESTISRATSNKYIQTPHGLFKLKSLFTSGINRANSLETDSSTSVKAKIKALIDRENKQKPFSDQKLVQLLERHGILISRRTVAKYREEMGIQGSTKRKRY
ncbi:RNA polymerase factor sigma-54 [Neobacillus sp. LXY-4]|uniref:RNA polymerase factor sigma-54 n=1 Tax=Neobacillus sp. LXY-4 TaxID=3379826 RepID=UPI003EE0FF22